MGPLADIRPFSRHAELLALGASSGTLPERRNEHGLLVGRLDSGSGLDPLRKPPDRNTELGRLVEIRQVRGAPDEDPARICGDRGE